MAGQARGARFRPSARLSARTGSTAPAPITRSCRGDQVGGHSPRFQAELGRRQTRPTGLGLPPPICTDLPPPRPPARSARPATTPTRASLRQALQPRPPTITSTRARTAVPSRTPSTASSAALPSASGRSGPVRARSIEFSGRSRSSPACTSTVRSCRIPAAAPRRTYARDISALRTHPREAQASPHGRPRRHLDRMSNPDCGASRPTRTENADLSHDLHDARRARCRNHRRR
jgi:hypothetical protein